MSDNSTNLDQSITERNVRLGFYISTFVIGLIGNLLVLIVITAKRSKRTVNELFIMNLAGSDLMLIFFLPLHIYAMFHVIPVNAFFCHFIRPLMTVSFFVSVYTLTSMAIHRCHVIINPFKQEIRQRSAVLWIAVIWLLSFINVLPLMIVTKPAPPTDCNEDWPSMQHRRAYTASLFVLQYVLPLFIIAIAYIRIGMDLYRPCSRGTPKVRNISENRARRRENFKVTKTLAIIVVVFALCMLPSQVGWMLLDFGNEHEKKIAMVIFKFSLILTTFHSCLNPVVYGSITRQFRWGYVKYLSYLCYYCRLPYFQKLQKLHFLESSSHKPSKGNEDSHHQVADKSQLDNNGSFELTIKTMVPSKQPIIDTVSAV